MVPFSRNPRNSTLEPRGFVSRTSMPSPKKPATRAQCSSFKGTLDATLLSFLEFRVEPGRCQSVRRARPVEILLRCGRSETYAPLRSSFPRHPELLIPCQTYLAILVLPFPGAPSCAPLPSDTLPYFHPRALRDGTELPPQPDSWRKLELRRGRRWAGQSPWRPGYRIASLRMESIADTSTRAAEMPSRECRAAIMTKSPDPCRASAGATLAP